MGGEGRKFLFNDPKRKNFKKTGTAKKDKDSESEKESNRHVAAIINGIMQANRNTSSSSTTTPSLPPMPQHGLNARPPVQINQVRAEQNNSDQSRTSAVTYDHNGNVV